jgi:hypothetical protein
VFLLNYSRLSRKVRIRFLTVWGGVADLYHDTQSGINILMR